MHRVYNQAISSLAPGYITDAILKSRDAKCLKIVYVLFCHGLYWSRTFIIVLLLSPIEEGIKVL